MWLLVRQVVTNILRIVELALVARNVAPSDFGVVALASVLLQVLTLVAEAGITTYVIYYRGDDWREEARSAFWMNLAVTLGQVALCLAAAHLVGAFFAEGDLVPVFLALVAVFFIRQAGVVQDALLRRQLRYRWLALRDITVVGGASALAVALALSGFGVWSLVLPELLLAPVGVAAATKGASWLPGRRLLVARWPRIFRYSKHLMVSNILQIVINDGDTLVVGRVLGSRQLGFYNLAWQLSNFVGRTVTSVVSDVSLPALAEAARRGRPLGPVYLRLAVLLAVIGQPLLGLLFAFAPSVVDLLYGPRYDPVAVLLRVLLVFTAIRVFTTATGTAFNVAGRPDLSLKANAATVPFYISAIAIGSAWGALGVAVGVVAVRCVAAVVVFGVSLRIVSCSTSSAASALLRVMVFATAASALAGAVGAALPIPPLAQIAVGAFLGLAAYAAALRLAHRVAWSELRGLTQSLRALASIGARATTT